MHRDRASARVSTSCGNGRRGSQVQASQHGGSPRARAETTGGTGRARRARRDNPWRLHRGWHRLLPSQSSPLVGVGSAAFVAGEFTAIRTITSVLIRLATLRSLTIAAAASTQFNPGCTRARASRVKRLRGSASNHSDIRAAYFMKPSLLEAPPAIQVMHVPAGLHSRTNRMKVRRRRGVKGIQVGFTASVNNNIMTTRATHLNNFALATLGPQRGDSAVAMLESRLPAGIRAGRWHVVLVAPQCPLLEYVGSKLSACASSIGVRLGSLDLAAESLLVTIARVPKW